MKNKAEECKSLGAICKCQLFSQSISFAFVGGGGAGIQSRKLWMTFQCWHTPTRTSHVHFVMVENHYKMCMTCTSSMVVLLT